MSKCRNCEFCDVDYEFDDKVGEEYEILTCKKGRDAESSEECVDYQECNTEKPIPTPDTKCDSCSLLKPCLDSNRVINCTTSYDSKQHYLPNIGTTCPQNILEAYNITLDKQTLRALEEFMITGSFRPKQ